MGTPPPRSIVDVLEQDIIPRLTIEDVYGDVVFRARSGRYWRAPCPLHDGDDPNFSVDTETLSWSCWSRCGHGSVVSYLNGGEPARGSLFVDLVRTLGRRVGIDLPDPNLTPAERRALELRLRRQELLEAYAALAHSWLGNHAGDLARQYLLSRGLPSDAASLTRLGIGVHPLPGALAQLRASSQELREAGLADSRWQGRVVIVWRDRARRVATVAARHIHSSADAAKYLYLANAHRPPFFGVDVLPSRSSAGPLVVVEGLLDALVLRAHGVERVVALGSSSPTRKHVEEIAVLGFDRVTLMLDADEAGDSGTRKFLELASQDVRLQVCAVPPDGYRGCKDPAELAALYGRVAIEDALASRLPSAVFLAHQLLAGINPTSPLAQRRDALRSVADLAQSTGARGSGPDIEDIVALTMVHTGYPEAVVRSELGAEQGSQAQSPGSNSSSTTRSLIEDVCGGHIPPQADQPDDAVIWRVVDTLDPRLSTVLSLRYGRHGPPLSLDAIAPSVSRPGQAPVSRERVRQLKEKALRGLRYPTRLVVLVGQEAAAALRPSRASTDTIANAKPAPSVTPAGSAQHQVHADAEPSPGRAAAIREVLEALGGSAPLGRLTHLLRGSRGPATQALIAEYSPPHVGTMAHLEFRAAMESIKAAASADARMQVVLRTDDPGLGPRKWVELASRPEREGNMAMVADGLTVHQASVLADLKAWRRERSRRDAVPAFVVAHDSTLRELARSEPSTVQSLLRVRGIGPARSEKYGDEIVAVVQKALNR